MKVAPLSGAALLPAFSGPFVDPRGLLKTGVIITPYAHHARLLPSGPLPVILPKSTQSRELTPFI